MAKTHDIESFVRETVEINTSSLLEDKDELPTPVAGLFLWSDQGRLEVAGVIVVDADGETCEGIHGEVPESTLPLNDEEDELLAAFCEQHNIDPDDLSWGDYSE